jgi:acyl-CoA thioester hydrolase
MISTGQLYRGKMPPIYRYDLKVTKEAIDENGHVNNVEYLRWMQDAAILHSESSGCTQASKAIGATWVVRTHRIEYFRPAFEGDDLSVLTWVSNFRRVQSVRKYKVLRVADNVVLSEGESNWVYVDAQSGKLRSIPKNVMASFEVVPEDKEPANLDYFRK